MTFGQPRTGATGFYSENDLLLALKAQDEKAIKYIYRQYWPMAIKLVKDNGGGEEEAKDVFQESMLDFLEKLWSESFALTCQARTFFYSVFRNKWRYHLRGSRSFVDIEEYIQLDAVYEDQPDESNRPDEEQLSNAVASLGEPCRSLLIGFYYEGLSMEKLAVKMGYKDAAVAKQQKFRCKDRLAAAVTKLPKR